jgi:hypothetical protein
VGREEWNEQVLPGTLEMLVLTVLSVQAEHEWTPGGCSASLASTGTVCYDSDRHPRRRSGLVSAAAGFRLPSK